MSTSIQFARRFTAAVLALPLLCGAASGWAQVAQSNTEIHSAPPNKLFITVLDGEGALNDIRARTAREPIVEVDDENHKPVAGALVLFAMDNGEGSSPFATFAGAPSVSVTTDAAGRAVGQGFAITKRKGRFQVHVHASQGLAVGDAVITEVNVAALGSGSATRSPTDIVSHKKLDWIIGSVAVAGVAIGVVIAETRSSTPTTVSAGSGTVGAPALRPGFRILFNRRVP